MTICKNCGHKIIFVGKSQIYTLDYIHNNRDFLECLDKTEKGITCGCTNPEPKQED